MIYKTIQIVVLLKECMYFLLCDNVNPIIFINMVLVLALF